MRHTGKIESASSSWCWCCDMLLLLLFRGDVLRPRCAMEAVSSMSGALCVCVLFAGAKRASLSFSLSLFLYLCGMTSLSLSLTLSRALAHERHQLDACPAVPAPDSSNFRALNLTSDQNFFLKTSFHPKVLDSYRRFLCMHLYIATFGDSGDI